MTSTPERDELLRDLAETTPPPKEPDPMDLAKENPPPNIVIDNLFRPR